MKLPRNFPNPIVRIRGLILATHFGPTVLVVSISFCLSLSQYSPSQSLEIAIAIFAGQCVVGWSNDLIDFPLDLAASRQKKPLVDGKISERMLRIAIPVALASAILLSFLGPLGAKGTALHALGIFSATAYNVKLKKTILSPLPYVISFGALPWAIFLSAGKLPPAWLYLAFIFFALAFHFLNVVKDLAWDRSQGILGLPQRLGKRGSLATAITFSLCGALCALSALNPLHQA